MSERDLEGQVAVVTGASRGIGHAIAQGLAARGARVASLSRSGGPVGLAVSADVRDPADVERARAEVERELGPASVLVNAAGVFGPIALVVDTDPQRWIDTLMVDMVGAYLTCRAFAPAMIDGGFGRIVNVTSAASLHPPGPTNSAYGTSKVALNQFTRHLAAELAGTGVTANVVHPGDVRTEMFEDIKRQAAALGPEAADYHAWVAWMDETGGDPPTKAADLVARIIASDVTGAFLWIDDPLQAPIPSWELPDASQPWRT
jgi:NAD(P)-dependent dehydrogenase (short-subunit alcohol dehydrogenase family)